MHIYVSIPVITAVSGLWCLTPLSTIFLIYRSGRFYWRMKPEYQDKTKSPVCTKTITHLKENRITGDFFFFCEHRGHLATIYYYIENVHV